MTVKGAKGENTGGKRGIGFGSKQGTSIWIPLIIKKACREQAVDLSVSLSYYVSVMLYRQIKTGPIPIEEFFELDKELRIQMYKDGKTKQAKGETGLEAK
jgi:hypothetical protein